MKSSKLPGMLSVKSKKGLDYMDMILKTTDLCKNFKGQMAVNNVSLNIRRNSVYGLLGPNGAGKSTILKMLTGILRPTSGSIEFDGHPWKRNDLEHIGALIEMPPLYENLTAYENLKVRLTLLGLDDARINEVLQTLIDISRAAVGYQLHIESIDLPAFMQHLFGYMESLCRTKEIRLQMNTVSLPQMLKFDRVLIERAIMNVISNGLDYSPQGGTLYVDVQSNNGFVEISVTDEGTGFSKEALCHAQERFYMGDQSRNSKLHFGMGLYITNSIMEQHNGQLILENSKETGGAKVTMKLPC